MRWRVMYLLEEIDDLVLFDVDADTPQEAFAKAGREHPQEAKASACTTAVAIPD